MTELTIIEPDVAEAAEWIGASWRAGVESIIETGRRLIEVRGRWQNERGKWSRLIGDHGHQATLPFGKTHAYRLIAISEDPRLLPHVGALPSDSYTLHELTRLSDHQFKELIAENFINPSMTRNHLAGKLRLNADSHNNSHTDAVSNLAELARSGRKFAAIYADPPWSFQVYSGKGKQRSAERHYDTMSLEDIEGLGEHVDVLAAEDSVLFLWAVMPQIPEALRVIEAWGFIYKTMGFTWVKLNKVANSYKVGMGYWTRSNAEICMLATKGAPSRQARNVEQLVVAHVGSHSKKPSVVQERITRLVLGPYLELFARRKVKGWTVWGDEIGVDLFDPEIEPSS